MSAAFKVELTAGAQDDLRGLYRYLADYVSVAQADSVLDALLEMVESLERWPARGAVPKELDALGVREYRQVLLTPWRVIYRVQGTSVFVVLIADGRRDMQALLEQRLLR